MRPSYGAGRPGGHRAVVPGRCGVRPRSRGSDRPGPVWGPGGPRRCDVRRFRAAVAGCPGNAAPRGGARWEYLLMRTGRGMAMGPGAARGAAGGRRIALDGRGLTAVPGVTRVMLPDADHTLTSHHARRTVIARMIEHGGGRGGAARHGAARATAPTGSRRRRWRSTSADATPSSGSPRPNRSAASSSMPPAIPRRWRISSPPPSSRPSRRDCP